MKHDIMWDRILTMDVLARTVAKTEDELSQISDFFNQIKEKMQCEVIVVMAVHWLTYDESKQVGLAIYFAGAYNASRFIALMDILADKVMKGEMR